MTSATDSGSKLLKEEQMLSMLENLLDRSDQTTQNMTSILSSFEDRLVKLEETILPVYHETENLQRRQQNIEKTLDSLDHVIGFYNVPKEVEAVIRDGPSGNLDMFLQCMEKIENAVQFFSVECPNSPESSTITSLMDAGKHALEKEFQSQMARSSQPVPAVRVLEVLNDLEENPQTDARISLESENLTGKVIHELQTIASWLVKHTENSNFCNAFADIRSSTILRSLKGLKDHQKSSSGGSTHGMVYTHSPGPQMRAGHKSLGDTPKRRLSKHSLDKGMRKVSRNLQQIMRNSPASITSLVGYGSDQGRGAQTVTEETSEFEVDLCLSELVALLKLLQSEEELMEAIIPETHRKKVFDKIVGPSLDSVIEEAQNIVDSTKRSVARHEYKAVLLIFPLLKLLQDLKSGYDKVLQKCCVETRSKLAQLASDMHSCGAMALGDFLDHIKTDSDKYSNLPSDGTVHELTSNTLGFLINLLHYDRTAGEMLASSDLNMSTKDLEDNNKRAMSHYAVRVLSTLGLNLNQKAAAYQDSSLASIFLLNNYNYILKGVQTQPRLKESVVLVQPNVETDYTRIMLDQKRIYSQSWSRLLLSVVESDDASIQGMKVPGSPAGRARGNQPALHRLQSSSSLYGSPSHGVGGANTGVGTLPLGAGAKMKEKERQLIKDKFATFNKELDEIYRTQKSFAVPDTKLRNNMRKDNKDYVLPKYQAFLAKFAGSQFTKNPDKYIRYTSQQVEELLDRFFDSAA